MVINEMMNMKNSDEKMDELKNLKIPEEKIEELMKECAADNSRLEDLIKEMDEGLVIRTTGENAGFNINYIKLDGDEKAVPLFTSSELMESTGLKSSTIVLFMSDLADMLKQTNRYSWVLINPFTDLDIHMPIESFLGLFNEMTLEQKEAMDKILFLLKTSIIIDQNIKVVFRCEEDVMKERAVNGVFVPDIPFKASSFPDFQKELKYTNIILIPKNKRILYLGGIVDKDVFDTIIAPETEFELVEELDEFTRVWGVGKQPFYDD